jgi:putative transposase
VIDLFSRRVVGSAMSARVDRELARDALAAHGIVCSMGRRGDCWDNAVAESFFTTLKLELVYDTDWATRADARGAIFDYPEVFYNGQRRPSALGSLSPLRLNAVTSRNSARHNLRVDEIGASPIRECLRHEHGSAAEGEIR